MITCSEKCIHEDEGLCTLNTVTSISGTPINDCPYFTEKEAKKL